jgi:hypothetical protein
MLEKYKAKLINAGWNIEPGNSIAPSGQESSTDVKVLWVATKNKVTLIMTTQWARVIKLRSRWAKTPIDMIRNGHILVPGTIAEQCEPGLYSPGHMIPHEGAMTSEEREIRDLLEQSIR